MSSPRRVLFGTAFAVGVAALSAPSCTDLVDVSPFPCALDGTCPAELVCAGGQCVPVCGGDVTCAEGRVCVSAQFGGVCFETCEIGDDCSEIASCKSTLAADGISAIAVCVKDGLNGKGAGCAFVEDCADGLTCGVGFVCTESCASDDDCPDGVTCQLSGSFGSCPTGPVGQCGNASCEAGETCMNCPNDCGACPQTCGDLFCDTAVFEDCNNCPNDCGACQGCNFFTGRCGFPLTCTLNESNVAVCQSTGSVQIGQQCFGGDCGVDAACWGVAPNFFCRQLCDDFHGCPVGFCTPVGGLPSNAGVCESF